MNEAITNVALVVASTPAVVFADPKKAEELFVHIEREIAEFQPDLSTDKGRKAIASLAYKVAQTKTAIDKAGAELNEEANKRINAVNAERRKFKARLETLQDRARKPLTEWEEAESKRQQIVAGLIAELKAVRVSPADTAAEIASAAERLSAITFDERVFADRIEEVTDLHKRVLGYLGDELARATKAEADRAELDRLRAEQAERDRIEQEAAAARRAEEQRAAAAKAEEERAARAAEEEQARIAKAAEDARREAEREAAAAREREQREHQEALAKAEREKQALIAEQDRKDREREAETKRVAEEDAKRAADKQHRTEVMAAAAGAMMDAVHISKPNADKLVLAILAGQIPNVTLRF
jgi:hypothetical protein